MRGALTAHPLPSYVQLARTDATAYSLHAEPNLISSAYPAATGLRPRVFGTRLEKNCKGSRVGRLSRLRRTKVKQYKFTRLPRAAECGRLVPGMLPRSIRLRRVRSTMSASFMAFDVSPPSRFFNSRTSCTTAVYGFYQAVQTVAVPSRHTARQYTDFTKWSTRLNGPPGYRARQSLSDGSLRQAFHVAELLTFCLRLLPSVAHTGVPRPSGSLSFSLQEQRPRPMALI